MLVSWCRSQHQYAALWLSIIYILSDSYILRADDGLAFVIVSMVLVIVGYGMGKAKEKWPGSDELADI